MSNSKKIDPGMLVYATVRQAEILTAVIEHGSERAAARALKCNRKSIYQAVTAVEKKAAAKGYAPKHDLTKEAAPGFRVGFVTTQYDGDGNVTQQWVRQNPEHQSKLEILRQAMEEIVDTGGGRLDPLRPPGRSDEDLLAVYPLADPHIGMLSWAKETGADFDLKIAEDTISRTVDRLVQCSPSAGRALFINLGDFLHVDNSSGRTERAGNILDMDSRFAKIAMAGMRIKRRIIDRLLQKHKIVEVWTIAGNHDENTSIMLALALQAIYEREPRVEVSTNPARFQVKTFGVSLIGAAHGHTASIEKLPAFMAANWPEEWGKAKQRVWYTGHVHHDSVKETPGCLVETLRTVAVRDAWHVGRAYHSGRDLKCDVWHKEEGRIARLIQSAIGG